MKLLARVFLFLGAMSLPFLDFAQCVMCRTQVVNNVSHGETSLAAGLNFGIIYLFVTPYIAISVIAFFWFIAILLKLNEQLRMNTFDVSKVETMELFLFLSIVISFFIYFRNSNK